MEETVVTIASYSTITDAAIFENLLKLEGIECVIVDSNAPLTPAVPQMHSGGVRLVVREEDAERAVEVINNSGVTKF